MLSVRAEDALAQQPEPAGALLRAVDGVHRSLCGRMGWQSARRALVLAAIHEARLPLTRGRRSGPAASPLRSDLADLFGSLPEHDPEFRGAVIAAVAERTLPASVRSGFGAVYTGPALAGFTIDQGLRVLGESPRRVFDPACGAGAFLAEAARRIRDEESVLHGMDRDWVALKAAGARLRLLGLAGSRVSLSRNDALMQRRMPAFDLVIGNPPYVRQEWLGGRERKRRLAARLERAFPGAGSALDSRADLSVAFLLLGLSRLRPGGVLAYVTSNAWLDALYGAPLRKFLARRAELRLVAEWEGKAFAYAAANPIVVVIRRTDGPGKRPAIFAGYAPRESAPARVSPDSPRAAGGRRWVARRRRVGARALAAESRWGAKLLRGNDLLDEIMSVAPGAFAPLSAIASLHYGTKPGLVDFFVLEGKTTPVEKRFLLPVLTSTSELASLEVRPDGLPRRLFVCPLSREDLEGGSWANALSHVLGGESARTRKKARHTRAGLPYPEVPSVRANSPWYHLRPRPAGDFAIPLLIRERHMIAYAPESITATNMFYQGRFFDRRLALPGTALLNSSLSLFALESVGRINIGGRINVYGPEIRPVRVPDPGRMEAGALRAIADAFGPLRARPVGTVSAEVQRPDRRALDAAVLEGAGIPARFAPLLAEALEERVARRLRREIRAHAGI